MTKLSVVVPVFNECTLIQELVRRLKLNVETITPDYEILIIDDGSVDATWEKIVFEVNLEKRIKGIKFSRNFGHHYAITAGLHESTGEWVVVMDGDLQDRPEVIPDLVEKIKEGYDIVFVSRKNRPEKFHYKLAQKIFYFFLRKLSGMDFDSNQANFSIISKKVVEAFKHFPEYTRFYGSTIKWLGFNRTHIFADHGHRFSGKPSYTLKKRIKLASDIILSFSERPLRIAIGLGVIISTSSFVLALWIVYRAAFYDFSVTGWASVISATLFSSGVTLVILGITGIYLGEVFKQVKNRPLYIIDKIHTN